MTDNSGDVVASSVASLVNEWGEVLAREVGQKLQKLRVTRKIRQKGLRTQEVDMPLGIPIVLSVGVVPTGGLKVGESGGPAIRSTATTGPRIGIHILYLVLGWKGNSTYIIFSRRRNNLFNRFSYDPIHMSWNDLFNQLRDSSPNFFRDDNRSGCSDILHLCVQSTLLSDTLLQPEL